MKKKALLTSILALSCLFGTTLTSCGASAAPIPGEKAIREIRETKATKETREIMVRMEKMVKITLKTIL